MIRFLLAALVAVATNSPITKNIAYAQTASEASNLETSPATESSAIAASTSVMAVKPWSLSLTNISSAVAQDLNYSNNRQKSYEASNYAGFKYKTSVHTTWGVRQYFTLVHDGPAGKNTTTVDDTVLTYSRSHLPGVWHSEGLAPELRYYAPTSLDSRLKKSWGLLRLDFEPTWLITPRWAVSYYLNPRQSFVSDAKTTLNHWAYLYYTPSDILGFYSFAGFSHGWKTAAQTLKSHDDVVGLGANINLVAGRISFNPEIYVACNKLKDGQKVASGPLLQEKNVTYYLTSAVAF